jgi:uncharacterized RDD family membrane protein YckC
MVSRDEFTIETPEQTRLEFPLAGIGSRFLALAFDTLLQIGAGILLFFAIVMLMMGAGASWPTGRQWTYALVIGGLFFINLGYFALFEAIWNGQTPGKRYTRLRVIKDTGQPLSPYEAITRNLLRIVDQLPGVYAVGIISILVSRQNKRLGDYAAGTVVVHEKAFEMLPALEQAARQPAMSVHNAASITAEELQLIETFLERRASLDPELRSRMAGEIAQRMVTKLGIRREDWAEPEKLLETLAAERRSIARFR